MSGCFLDAISGLQRLRVETNTDPNMTYVLAFLQIAAAGDISYTQLADILGIPGSKISDICFYWGDGNERRKIPAHRLVESYTDPSNYRHKRVRLTLKGKGLATLMAEQFQKMKG